MTIPQPSNHLNGNAGPKTIAIWGGGLIGLSTAAHFARRGIKSIIYDISQAQIDKINAADFPKSHEEWIGVSAKHYIVNSWIRATNNQAEVAVAAVKVHFIAVPTERDGEPYMGAIESVLGTIASMSPELVIIESTVIPGTTIALGQKLSLPLGVATRRDWFTTSENNLENCVRIFCGTSDDVSDGIEAILSVVCKRLIRASSCTVVELTKALDNGIFHTNAMYASQVAAAYPEANVAEALELAATHWRLGNHVYFPSLGTGGPCVPIANKYLLTGASDPRQLSLAASAIRYDANNPRDVAARIKSRLEPGDKVAILGICYRGDIKAHSESPHVKFARELVRLGTSIGVHDPYYSEQELKDIVGGFPIQFPHELKHFRFVYLGTNHNLYTKDVESIIGQMCEGQTILDNQGIWQASSAVARSRGISYFRVGGASWLPPSANTESTQSADERESRAEEPPVVFKTKFFDIRAVPNKHPEAEPWYVVHRPDSVVIIPVTTTAQVLLQKIYRPHSNQSSWEFPGGAIDQGESPSQAAARELAEETSLRCTSLESLGSFLPMPGFSAQRTHVFLAQVSENHVQQPSGEAQEEGISAFRVVDLSTLRAMISGSDIVDGFTLSAFAYWQAVRPLAVNT